MTSNVTNSAESQVRVGERAHGTESIDAVVGQLRETFRSRRTRSLQWRARQLAGIERMLDEREDDIAHALKVDLGRSAAEVFIGDVASTRAEASFARKHLRKWARPRRTSLPMTAMPGRGWYQYEPLGVVLVIGPWNYPLYLTLGPLIGALAAGNCAVVKPSEHAPESSRLLANLIAEYLDNDAVAVVEGESEVTQALLAQGLDHAFFTGGTEIGRRVMEAAAPHLTPVTLELGGKSPVIVAEDADIEVAARRIAWMKLLNSGQTCIAPDYVLVERSVQSKLVEQVISTVRRFVSDQPDSHLRIANRRQLERLERLLADCGGKMHLGGKSDQDAVTLEPTVVVDPDTESALMREEIFGPILPVIGVDSLDEAISFVNSRPKPLGAYLFSRSKATRDRVLNEVSSGGAVINHIAFHCLVPQLPFGGVGESGMGGYHGKWGFETFSHRKAVVSKPSRPDPSLLYPPYTSKKLKLIRRFF